MTHGSITSVFKATGLNPLNPQALPETDFDPSLLLEVPAPIAGPVDGENSQLRIYHELMNSKISISTAQEERINSITPPK